MTAAAKRSVSSYVSPRAEMAVRAALTIALSLGLCAGTFSAADAATPKIRTSAQNYVPACVTPQRLMAFLRDRNPNPAPRFRSIADWYKKHGEAWHVRWDYAFFQMAVETNFLTFKRGDGSWGDARPKQNNFAGLGTTGGGVPGDSYPDVSTGVLAQIQHLVVYSGERIANPVGPRTRLKQDDIIASTGSKKGRMAFGDLAGRWAADRHYGAAIEWVAGKYRKIYCNGPDARRAHAPPAQPLPRATALGGPAGPKPSTTAAKKAAPVRTIWSRDTHVATRTKPVMPELPTKAPNAIAREKPKAPVQLAQASVAPAASVVAAAQPRPMQIALADPQQERTTSVVTSLSQPTQENLQAFSFAGRLRVASLDSNAARSDAAAASNAACSVVAASYGGEKTLLVRGTETSGEVRYTVLTVLAGFERSMLENYISVHAPGGASLGEFESQEAAIAKARELCPSSVQTSQPSATRAG